MNYSEGFNTAHRGKKQSTEIRVSKTADMLRNIVNIKMAGREMIMKHLTQQLHEAELSAIDVFQSKQKITTSISKFC